jgi:hypothetical protein
MGTIVSITISLVSLAISSLTYANSLPKLYLNLSISDHKTMRHAPQTFFDVEITNLHSTAHITDMRVSVYVGPVLKRWQFWKQRGRLYHQFDVEPYIMAGNTRQIGAAPPMDSLEQFVSKQFPPALKAESYDNRVGPVPPHPTTGQRVPGSIYIPEHAYYFAKPLKVSVTVKYRAGVAGSIIPLRRSAHWILEPVNEEGSSKLSSWTGRPA